MKIIAIAAALLALTGCSNFYDLSKVTYADAASASAIASAAGLTEDAQCWAAHAAVQDAVRQQLATGAGGLASAIELKRAMKAIAARPSCLPITVELLNDLMKIPNAGPIVGQLLNL